MNMDELASTFGSIDIYLFDQLLRGRIPAGATVLDAGCGRGRNLVYLMRTGYQVFACDRDRDAVESVRRQARVLAPALPESNFRVEPLETPSFEEAFADFVISSAVLHFARDDEEFEKMLRGSFRSVKPGGTFFCRLASTIGIATEVRQIEGRRFTLPDGSDRYLVDEALLMKETAALGGELLDPLKTTVVQNQRAMTTWVVRKRT
jgi:tellurite methyltransferase